MKKTLVGPLLTIIAVVLVAALFLYFFVSLNRLDKKLTAVSTTVTQDSSQISAIVNFFNSNLNGQAATTTK